MIKQAKREAYVIGIKGNPYFMVTQAMKILDLCPDMGKQRLSKAL